MKSISFFTFVLLFFLLPKHLQANTNQQLTINIFSRDNGVGLEAHRKILQEALFSLGHRVYARDFDDLPTRMDRRNPADINIHIQQVNPYWLELAKHNWLMPFPEWFVQDLLLLDHIDLVICVTHEGERVFQEIGKPTFFTGFTSFNCNNGEKEKNFDHILHLAGCSTTKNTEAVSALWQDNQKLPQITVIARHYPRPYIQENVEWIIDRVPEKELRHYQNHCGFHLCPSVTEGFGHYIMEAMSTGAVVIVPDAPPMNEFITDKRCLVPYHKTQKMYLATGYFVAPEDIEKSIHSLRLLPESELRKIGENNRAMYFKKTEEFRTNLNKLFDEYE